MDFGVEGYGIYFMILEILREQQDFKYPIEDIKVMAYELNVPETKVRSVIFSYDLFQMDNDKNFFSLKFIYYLQPYIEKSQRARLAAEKRWEKTKEIGVDNEEQKYHLEVLNEDSDAKAYANAYTNADAFAMQVKERKVNESKGKESKANEKKGNNFDAFAFMNVLGFDENLIIDFLKVRKAKKAVNTERAFQSIIKEIEKTGIHKNEVLLKMIVRSWAGFEAKWLENEKKSKTNQSQKTLEQMDCDELNEYARKINPYLFDHLMKISPFQLDEKRNAIKQYQVNAKFNDLNQF